MKTTIETAGTAFNAGLGIERVIPAREGPGISLLPDSTRVLPSESFTGRPLLHALYAPAWDEAMREFLQPRVRARELLIPGVFSHQLRQARRSLNEQALRTNADALRQAADLLQEDDALRGMLETCRNLLLPG